MVERLRAHYAQALPGLSWGMILLAAGGAALGAAAGALIPGVSLIEGAAVGAAIGGLGGAVWADNNNDG